MPNNLGNVVEKYTRILDELVVAEAKTADLTANQNLLGEFVGAGQIQVAKILMDGLGDYGRDTGFVNGDITLDWEVMNLQYDRGRSFSIDIMDDEERLRIVTLNLMAQFVRTKVIPEVDAIRFAKLFAGSAVANRSVHATFATPDAASDAVLAAEEALEDVGVPLSECFLYCTSAFKGLLRKAQNYRMMPGDTPNTLFERFDDMRLIPVPQNRFYTAIDLYDGTTSGEEGGGYVKHTSTGQSDPAGQNINFMVVHPEACAAITKHQTLRYFAPEVNQAKDAHLWQYRLYHDMLVYDNKAGLIFVDTVA